MFSEPRNVLGEMFEWWNLAYREQGGFTSEAFARYFTPEARFRVNGTVRASGLEALAKHFSSMQASTDHVELERPALIEFVSADGTCASSHHFATARVRETIERERVMAIAFIQAGRITALDIVSVPASLDARD